MSSNRRVGTLTLGCVLILSGGGFLLHLFVPTLSYLALLNFWPVILIILGIETLVSYAVNKEEKIRYDGWSVVIVIAMSFFSVCMGSMQFLIEQYPQILTRF